jgi:hypothetical protein
MATRFLPLLICVCMLTCFLLTLEATAQNTAVEFPDENLRWAVVDWLEIDFEDPITQADMADLFDLDGESYGIVDLTGLEYATGLNQLFLSDNEIEDISPLSGLTKLTTLFLDLNYIEDISPLLELTELISLDLSNNSITDISPLRNMSKLITLSLGQNKIQDISILPDLSVLRTLDLSDNLIEDLRPLVDHTEFAGFTGGRGRTVTLSRNPLNITSISEHLSTLEERGINVQFPDEYIKIISGNNQESVINETLPEPFVIQVLNRQGEILSGKEIRFSVFAGVGSLDIKMTMTDADGRAESTFMTGNEGGTIFIIVSLTSEAGSWVILRVKVSVVTDFKLLPGGANQTGVVGQPLAEPFIIEVVDQWEDVFPDVPITFEVSEGGGTLSVPRSFTDETGRVSAVLTLGPDPGRNVVDVFVGDIPNQLSILAIGELPPSDQTEFIVSILGTPPREVGAFPITFSFSKPLKTDETLDVSEINVTNGTLAPLTKNTAGNYDTELTPADGVSEVSITVVADAVRDETNNPNPESHRTIVLDRGSLQESFEIVLSEFMFESVGGEDSLPQWIEVYNNSTKEVNLNGWKLHWKRLQPIPFEVTTTFKEDFIIPVAQSRLIVTSLGRHAGGAKLSEDAVYQLYSLHAEELTREDIDLRNRLIDRGGFSLKLTNPTDVLVDHIGTLTDDKQTWQLHECLIEGVRSSLIRRFDEGAPRSGTERRGWHRAIDSKRLVAGIYYGHSLDLGTPAYRRGKPLPVQLSQFSARSVKDEVVINWTTESELNNAGFNVLRSTSRTKNFRRINTKLIQGAGTTGERRTYQFIDKTAKPNVAYYYRIVDVDFSGTHRQLTTQRVQGVITPTDKRITTWGTLKDDR